MKCAIGYKSCVVDTVQSSLVKCCDQLQMLDSSALTCDGVFCDRERCDRVLYDSNTWLVRYDRVLCNTECNGTNCEGPRLHKSAAAEQPSPATMQRCAVHSFVRIALHCIPLQEALHFVTCSLYNCAMLSCNAHSVQFAATLCSTFVCTTTCVYASHCIALHFVSCSLCNIVVQCVFCAGYCLVVETFELVFSPPPLSQTCSLCVSSAYYAIIRHLIIMPYSS